MNSCARVPLASHTSLQLQERLDAEMSKYRATQMELQKLTQARSKLMSQVSENEMVLKVCRTNPTFPRSTFERLPVTGSGVEDLRFGRGSL